MNIVPSTWKERRVNVKVLTKVGEIEKVSMSAHTHEKFSFGVAKVWTGTVTWTLIHLKFMRMSPSCLPTRDKAIAAAELFENLGNWDAALGNWVEFGQKVPFGEEARQVVKELGGVTLSHLPPLTPSVSEKPKYMC